MGGYGMIRMAWPFFPEVVDVAKHPGVVYTIIGLSLVSIVYGAFVAMAQTDFKKLVAYSSVSHMGFVTLGLASLTHEGMNGAMYMMLAHGTISAMLFMVVGVIYDRAHHRDLDRFGGLAWVMPGYFVLAAFALFASLGLPGLSGFIAELTVLLGSFQPHKWLTLIATIGMVVTAAYYLITLQKVFLGDTPLVYRDKAHYPDATGREMLVLVPLAIVTLWMGILPQPWMDIYQTDLQAIMDHAVSTAKSAAGK
jgi:NADH-quinone oxidoreductase subunit M